MVATGAPPRAEFCRQMCLAETASAEAKGSYKCSAYSLLLWNENMLQLPDTWNKCSQAKKNNLLLTLCWERIKVTPMPWGTDWSVSSLPGPPPHSWAGEDLLCHTAWTQLEHRHSQREITGSRTGEKWRLRARLLLHARDLLVSSMQTKLAHFITLERLEKGISVLRKSPGSYIAFHT